MDDVTRNIAIGLVETVPSNGCVSTERAGVTDLWSDHVKMKSCSWEISLAFDLDWQRRKI